MQGLGVFRETFNIEVNAGDYGFPSTPTPRTDRSVVKNIELGLSALRGEKGPTYDRIVLNAAMADHLLGCSGATDILSALERSREAIDSGKALNRLLNYIKMSHKAMCISRWQKSLATSGAVASVRIWSCKCGKSQLSDNSNGIQESNFVISIASTFIAPLLYIILSYVVVVKREALPGLILLFGKERDEPDLDDSMETTSYGGNENGSSETEMHDGHSRVHVIQSPLINNTHRHTMASAFSHRRHHRGHYWELVALTVVRAAQQLMKPTLLIGGLPQLVREASSGGGLVVGARRRVSEPVVVGWNDSPSTTLTNISITCLV
eukprot:Gb_27875 [translate_table: standard]